MMETVILIGMLGDQYLAQSGRRAAVASLERQKAE
jgi:hypothetical protein